jgi:hypothetical protein
MSSGTSREAVGLIWVADRKHAGRIDRLALGSALGLGIVAVELIAGVQRTSVGAPAKALTRTIALIFHTLTVARVDHTNAVQCAHLTVDAASFDALRR